MTAPLRVLVTQQDGGGSGAPVSTMHLALGMARQGALVRFAGPPGTPAAQAALDGGLPFHPVDLRENSARRNRGALAQLLAEHPVDVVCSQSSSDRNALTGLALRRALRVPFVVTRRQMPQSSPLRVWLTSRYAARTIAVSHPVAEALIRLGAPRARTIVVPNGLVTSRVDQPVSPQRLDGWRRRIGMTGTHRTIGIIARRKDQHVVLRAMHHVATPVRLVLAGVTADEPLAAELARVPARHHVVCVGFDPDVRPLYDLLEWLLLPSRMEGLSQALLEGMALGVPVMASAAGGNIDLIRDGVDGRLLPPLDAPAWARAINEGLADRGLAERLGAAGRRRAREDFSLEQTVRLTLECLAQVVGSR